MAIEIIHDVFPGVQVQWERTPRVANPMMTINETRSGDEIHTFPQRDMSDDFYGPGVDELRARLKQHKKSLS
jgi:hypothetical protein